MRETHNLRLFGATYYADLESPEVRALEIGPLTLWLYLQASTPLHQGADLELERALSEIATRLSRHPSTVRRWARVLEVAGLVEREHRVDLIDGGREVHLPVIWHLRIPATTRARLDARDSPTVAKARTVAEKRAKRAPTKREARRARRAIAELERDLAAALELEAHARRACGMHYPPETRVRELAACLEGALVSEAMRAEVTDALAAARAEPAPSASPELVSAVEHREALESRLERARQSAILNPPP